MAQQALKLSSYSLLTIDDETRATLDEYQRFLTEYVGPMARIFIKEVVIYLSRDNVFLAERLDEAVTLLADKIEHDEGKKAFLEKFSGDLF